MLAHEAGEHGGQALLQPALLLVGLLAQGPEGTCLRVNRCGQRDGERRRAEGTESETHEGQV
jgi:hypothetical protein